MKKTGLFGLLALLYIAVSCENVLPPSEKDACTVSQTQLMDRVEKGNLEALKKYLENGGDPAMSCVDSHTSGGHYGSGYYKRELYSSIIISRSDEIQQYYLSYKLPSSIKDEMLNTYASDTINATLAQLLVKKGAHITNYADRCLGITVSEQAMRNLYAYGYDFNWKDPADGNTLLMKYALCPGEGEEQDIISLMKLLIEFGAKSDIKNNAGKQAKDIAINQTIRNFLKSL